MIIKIEGSTCRCGVELPPRPWVHWADDATWEDHVKPYWDKWYKENGCKCPKEDSDTRA